jgi:hypothetical protein
MKIDLLRILYTYAIATFLIVGTYYALVIYPYELSDSVKLWLTASSGGAIAFVFGDQIANRTKNEQQSAFNAGLYATPPTSFVCPLDSMTFVDQAALDQHTMATHG